MLPDPARAVAWVARHQRLMDAALVAIVLAMFEMPAFDPYRHDSRQWWPVWGFVIAVPLWWRRSRPAAVLGLSLAGTAGALLTRSGPNWGALSQATLFIGPVVALASAAADLPRLNARRLALATSVIIVALTVATASAPDTMVAQLAVVGGAWAVGEAFRARRHEIALLQELVDTRAAQAASVERNRIARELHDVVAHQLAVIAIQAGAARMMAGSVCPDPGLVVGTGGTAVDGQSVGTQPAGAASAGGSLVAIEEASRAALGDLRRALGVLRGPEAAEVGPQPGLDHLDLLAGRLREAGLPLDVLSSGDVGDIPTGIGVSAYRIVQESLTNVLNHAGRVATWVRVVRTPSELQLDVRNDPPSAAAGGTRGRASEPGGRGVLGMRERVTAWCGTFDAGPLPDGGYAVRARIPLP